jgi:hypothetical protein
VHYGIALATCFAPISFCHRFAVVSSAPFSAIATTSTEEPHTGDARFTCWKSYGPPRPSATRHAGAIVQEMIEASVDKSLWATQAKAYPLGGLPLVAITSRRLLANSIILQSGLAGGNECSSIN